MDNSEDMVQESLSENKINPICEEYLKNELIISTLFTKEIVGIGKE